MPPTSMEINAAMRYIYDQMERCVIPDYIILGDAARAVNDGEQIKEPLIEIGIREKEFTKEVLSLFLEWGYKYDGEKNEWTHDMDGVKIVFKIIKRNYKFFAHLDSKFYDVDEYHVANPFDLYWKSRFLIR